MPMFGREGGVRVSLFADPALTSPAVLRRPFLFPISPVEQVDLPWSYTWNDYDTVSAGTFSRPVRQDPLVVQFTTLFTEFDLMDLPAFGLWPYAGKPGVGVAVRPTPLEQVEELLAIMKSAKPFKFVISQPELWDRPEVSMLATLRAVQSSQKAGETDARYVTVNFTEYRRIAYTARKRGQAKGGANSPHKLPVTLTIAKLPDARSTVYGLATFYYGSAHKWRSITQANRWLVGVRSPSEDLRLASAAVLRKHPRIVVPALGEAASAVKAASAAVFVGESG